MARLTTDRMGWGAVDHPETGELVQLHTSIDRDTAEIVAHHYDEIRLLSEADDHPDAEDVEDEEYSCGVNGCSRSVDSPEDVCWQHED